MGRCVYIDPAGGEICNNVSAPGACDVGGTYYDYGSCPDCFFVTELSSHIIKKSEGDHVMEVAALPAVRVAYDFRDVILQHSTLGREVAALYYAHAKSAIEHMRKHPKLLLRALRLVTKGILLAQDIVRAHLMRGRAGVVLGAMKLDDETVREVISVAHELAKLSDKKEFDSLVASIEKMFKPVAGMNTIQILDHFKVESR